MAWSTPHVFASGEHPSSANMNISSADLVYLKGDLAWTAPTYTNGWVDFGGGFQTVGFRLVGDEVFLRGSMKSGTMNTSAFTLPVGYRPLAAVQYAVQSNGAFGYVSISVGGAGLVVPVVGTNASVTLDGIHFSVI